MKGKVTFNKSGAGSVSARVTIPNVFVELLEITKEERDIDISYEDGRIIIKKVQNKEE